MIIYEIILAVFNIFGSQNILSQQLLFEILGISSYFYTYVLYGTTFT